MTEKMLFRSVFHQQPFIAELTLQQRISEGNKALRQIGFSVGNTVGILADCTGERLAAEQCGYGLR